MFIHHNRMHSVIFIGLFLFSFIGFIPEPCTAQTADIEYRLGLSYGRGSQDQFPIRSPDYLYDLYYFKFQFHYPIGGKRRWKTEFIAEPSVYIAEHQLLNIYYITPESGENYQEQRDQFSKKRTINEYVVNLGLLLRYALFDDLSVYGMASIGPMISDTETERLAQGFAFSDIIAFGTTYHFDHLAFDFRYVFRHVSNANLQSPNIGHNSSSIEAGILFLW